MKNISSFISFILIFITALTAVVFSQSESSAIKTIKQDAVNVTEPMIAVNPTDPNNFIAVFSNWTTGINRKPASSRTTDGGITWTTTQVPANLLVYNDQGDPTITFDADGNAHYCYLDDGTRRNIMIAHSTDKGASWSSTSTVYDGLNPINGIPTPDKPWITVDCTNGPNRNTIYVVWTAIFTSGGYDIHKIYLSYKQVGQNNFSTPVEVSTGASQQNGVYVQGAFPVVGNNGTLYVFWSYEHYWDGWSQIRMRKSINGGQSFTGSEQTIKSGITNPYGQILGGNFRKAHSWPYVAVNPVDGSLNLVYGNYKTVYFSNSTNGGSNWSTSSIKGMKPSGVEETWNPIITCNSDGKLAITYYAADFDLEGESDGGTSNNYTKVYVATGYANDPSFTIFSQGDAFDPTYPTAQWNYTDYIGIACNDLTYWAVYPAPAGSQTKIVGKYRTVIPVVENLTNDYLPLNGTQISFDLNNNLTSPYSPSPPGLIPGSSHTLNASSQLAPGGGTYNFYRWEDETGSVISSNNQINVSINNHRYRAMYALNPVNVFIKNEFKEPAGAISNGGTVNIDYQDYLNTQNLPGQQVTKVFNEGEQHRFEAKQQTFGFFYRGFNYFPQHDGGWEKPDLDREYTHYINTPVIEGPYTAKYRNKYNVYVNGFAPEINSTVNNISSPSQIWQYESGPITAPLTQPFPGGITCNFAYWSDGVTESSRTVSITDNTTYTAVYKYANHSNDPTTFSNSSQKKVAFWGWKVYESLGSIWLEKDNVLMNGGKPVNDLTEGPEAKSPSLDYCTDQYYNNYIYIVYQQKLINNKYKIKLAKFNENGQLVFRLDVMTSENNYSAIDVTPVIAVARSYSFADNNPKFLIVWRQIAESGYQDGLYFFGGIDEGSSVEWYYLSPQKFTSTDSQSSNPTSAVYKNPYGVTLYHVAWQQGDTQIKYRGIYDNWNGGDAGGFSETGSLETPSSGSGITKNTNPSITVINTNATPSYTYDSPKLTWLASFYPQDFFAMFRDKSNSLPGRSWNNFHLYYSGDGEIKSANINRTDIDNYFTFVYSENSYYGLLNKYVKSTNLSSVFNA
jgi:hypothetical protein